MHQNKKAFDCLPALSSPMVMAEALTFWPSSATMVLVVIAMAGPLSGQTSTEPRAHAPCWIRVCGNLGCRSTGCKDRDGDDGGNTKQPHRDSNGLPESCFFHLRAVLYLAIGPRDSVLCRLPPLIQGKLSPVSKPLNSSSWRIPPLGWTSVFEAEPGHLMIQVFGEMGKAIGRGSDLLRRGRDLLRSRTDVLKRRRGPLYTANYLLHGVHHFIG